MAEGRALGLAASLADTDRHLADARGALQVVLGGRTLAKPLARERAWPLPLVHNAAEECASDAWSLPVLLELMILSFQ